MMQAQMLINIAQKSTNKAQSEGVGCGGAFNLGRASFLEVKNKERFEANDEGVGIFELSSFRQQG